MDIRTECEFRSFLAETENVIDLLKSYGGSTYLCGVRVTFRHIPRLEAMADRFRQWLDNGCPEDQNDFQKIIDLIKNPRPITASSQPQPGNQKTYVVGRSIRYRIRIYLEHLDKMRKQMEEGSLQSAEALGKTYTDAVEFGDFVKTVRALYDKTRKDRVSGKEYGFAMQCNAAYGKLENGEAV